jgi:hypothetical protein
LAEIKTTKNKERQIMTEKFQTIEGHFPLALLVSKITVSKETRSSFPNMIIKECKDAMVIQK